MTPETGQRRPLKSRDTGWAHAAARALARAGVSADAISAASLVAAAAGATVFVASGLEGGALRGLLLVCAAACVQARLLCNLLDGMVAVEHARGGPDGPIWNELPDRLADTLLLAGAGYGAALAGAGWGEAVGWLAAVMAILTAYVRELGRALGFAADFRGPGAKPHRMAVLTGAALAAVFEPLWSGRGATLAAALGLVAGLAAWTAVRRTALLAHRLRVRAGSQPS